MATLGYLTGALLCLVFAALAASLAALPVLWGLTLWRRAQRARQAELSLRIDNAVKARQLLH